MWDYLPYLQVNSGKVSATVCSFLCLNTPRQNCKVQGLFGSEWNVFYLVKVQVEMYFSFNQAEDIPPQAKLDLKEKKEGKN